MANAILMGVTTVSFELTIDLYKRTENGFLAKTFFVGHKITSINTMTI